MKILTLVLFCVSGFISSGVMAATYHVSKSNYASLKFVVADGVETVIAANQWAPRFKKTLRL